MKIDKKHSSKFNDGGSSVSIRDAINKKRTENISEKIANVTPSGQGIGEWERLMALRDKMIEQGEWTRSKGLTGIEWKGPGGKDGMFIKYDVGGINGINPDDPVVKPTEEVREEVPGKERSWKDTYDDARVNLVSNIMLSPSVNWRQLSGNPSAAKIWSDLNPSVKKQASYEESVKLLKQYALLNNENEYRTGKIDEDAYTNKRDDIQRGNFSRKNPLFGSPQMFVGEGKDYDYESARNKSIQTVTGYPGQPELYLPSQHTTSGMLSEALGVTTKEEPTLEKPSQTMPPPEEETKKKWWKKK